MAGDTTISRDGIAPQGGDTMLCGVACAWMGMVGPILDRLEHGVVLVQPPTRSRFENQAARRLLDAEDDRESLYEAIHLVTCATLRRMPGDSAVDREVTTRASRYHLRASRIPTAALCDVAGLTVLVTIDPLTLALPKRETLMRRFGFTPREADVGILLANGARNHAIAVALALSPNTVRHYTESVMIKLGVHSRAEAARSLLMICVAPMHG